MRRLAAAVASLVVATTLAGCASPTLDVGYPESAANRALLAAIEARRVGVAAVTDRRADTSRIGASPESGKPIVTSRAVPDIVRDAIVVELGTNGVTIVSGPGDLVVTATVEEFWLDAVGRSKSTQYVGRVVIAVAIADGRTGDRLASRRYVGITRRTADADSKAAWRDTMDTALARAIHDFATDPDLVARVRHAAL